MEYMGSIHFGLKICRVNMVSEGMSFIQNEPPGWIVGMPFLLQLPRKSTGNTRTPVS